MQHTTVITIPHEKIALELCAKLVQQGKTFRCVKTSNGWSFEVLT
jgi:hypothetical protein